MNATLLRMCRSGLAMLLAVCMVCSMVPFGALAASTPEPGVSGIEDVNSDGIITYVSFGDSVTNGYGMDGYRFADGTNVLGFRKAPAASYPALIRDYLTEQGYTVDLEQMAISGFRMDELHWMLCDCYEADSYHDYQFANWNRSAIRRLLNSTDPEAMVLAKEIRDKYEATYGDDTNMIANADNIIMSEYRNAVKNADLITIDLGTNNFGTFVTNTIQEILGLKTLDYKVDFTQYVDANTAASLDAMLGQMVANMLGTGEGASYDLAMTLARCLMYGYLGYTENYDGAIEAIYELNPDAKVVVIDCYTMITGVELEGGALGENIDLDALYDMFIDLANFYSRELSPYANKVTHATMETAPELFIDYYKDYPDADYPDNQYMHPSAERLMNEFIMENMGYDPDEPSERTRFQNEVLNNIQKLDGYVNNIQNTVKENVIDTVDQQIKEKLDETVELVQTAIDGVETAQDAVQQAVEGVAAAKEAVAAAADGVKTAREAVQTAVDGVATAQDAVNQAVTAVNAAKEGVTTAVDGVALAQKIVDMLVENLISNSMFKGSSTSSMIKGIILDKIEEQISDELMIQAGFEVTDANRTALAEEAYLMGCIYYDELNVNGGTAESANKLAVLEGIRFMLVTVKGYSEEDAVATANQAYELNAIYQSQGEEAAIKAAIQSQITDEQMAQFGLTDKAEAAALVYTLGTSDNKTAVITAMSLKVDEATAQLAYELNTIYQEQDEVAAVKAAIQSQITDEQLAQFGLTDKAEAAELVYTLGTIEDEKTAVIAAMAVKVGEETAELAYELNSIYESQGEPAAVKAAMLTQVTDEATVDLALQMYAVYANAIENGATEEAAFDTTVITAMVQVGGYQQAEAEAIYAVYKGTADAATQKAVYTTLLTGVKLSETVTIDADLAAAMVNCYVDDLDGQFNNDNVKTTMYFFMVYVGAAADAAAAADLYDQYLMYKNLPTTLSKIAKVDTIYFDALLAATANNSLDLSSVAKEFMAGTLVLEEPGEGASEEEWAEYKSDSALATLFFRFMSQDGIYTHPSEAGQRTLYNAAKSVLDSLLTAEEDSTIEITDETKLLVLGDFVTANKNSYVSQVVNNLGIDTDNVTNLSNADYRLNDVRALLDDTYAKDAYAADVLADETADYKAAVQDSDVILVNLGSMNMGLIAKQLSRYMTDGSTYSMEFTDLDNMQTQYLGATMDAFLNNFSGAFDQDAIGALMLAFETYGYGYTTFADCLDNTIETIQALNPEADIVLVGMYDLLGDAYLYEANSGMYLEMGHFVNHAVTLMNQHMEIYAEMTDNVTYVDVSDTVTTMNSKGKVNMMDGGVAGIAEAFTEAVPTEEGYASMAKTITCALAHTPENAEAITWAWNDDHTATVSFTCSICGQKVTVPAVITTETTDATCEADGKTVYTAEYLSYTCTETQEDPISATGHAYSEEPEWYREGGSEWYVTATFSCINGCGHSVTVEGELTEEITEATCTEFGSKKCTATVEFEGKTYTTEVYNDLIAPSGHCFGEWTVTTAPTCTAEGVETRTCAKCGTTETQDVAPLGHNYVSVVTAPTCTEGGYTTYTCDRCDESYIADETPATGHSYGEDGKCTVCGEVDPDAHPVCEYTVAETLVSGNTYILALGGTQVGSYTFTEVDGGWTIQAADGTYLAIEDEALVNSSTAFTWTYSNGAFSATVETESSNNWWGGWFGNWWGSSSEETYYLVASGSGVGISTDSTGSEATFYTARSDVSHNFNAGTVTAPTCTEGGYTTYTCDRCGYSYTGSYTEALGHNYESTVTAPTCTEGGYTTYTCATCGDSYVDNHTDALGHNYVDGICTNCGHDTNKPVEPEIPEGECTYLAEQTLTSGGTFILSLGGNQVGTYTFTQVSDGWTIQAADGSYLALENEALVNSTTAFTWTYSNGYFSTTVETESSGNNWWGSFFGSWWGSSSSEETYYLVSSGSTVTVSTSNSAATAKFYLEVTGEHVYGDPVASNGSHVFTCVNCGNQKSVTCSDADCELCHPKATISVSVDITSKSSGNNWWGSFFGDWWGSGSSTTYTATITVNAEGTEVESVAYSTDGGNTWTTGTSFTSSSEITAFDIRVIGTNGITYYFAYNNGTVTQVG